MGGGGGRIRKFNKRGWGGGSIGVIFAARNSHDSAEFLCFTRRDLLNFANEI